MRAIAVSVVSHANNHERRELLVWANTLLEIKRSSLSPARKTKAAIQATANSRLIVSTVKIVAREIKRIGWINRGIKGRFGISGAVAAVVLFGGQSAGIAALGTAIGVPLWVVFGAGATFLGVMIEEITQRLPMPSQAPRPNADSNTADDLPVINLPRQNHF